MQQRLAELLVYMDETRDRLVAEVSSINPAFAAMKPRADCWSVEENVAHLAMVEPGVARLVCHGIEWGRSNGVGAPTSDDSVLGSLDRYALTEVVRKMDAPSSVAPPTDKRVAESLATLAASRVRLREALVAADQLDLVQVKRPHRILGEIDLYQWALFVAQHEERHRKQIARTIAELTELAAESAPIV